MSRQIRLYLKKKSIYFGWIYLLFWEMGSLLGFLTLWCFWGVFVFGGGRLLRVGDSIESVCCTRSPKSPRGSISGGEDGSIISNRHECTVSIGNFSDLV